VNLRNPGAVRPWQHVLDPLTGYLSLAQRLYDEGSRWSSAWNFGPSAADEVPVSELVDLLLEEMGSDNQWRQEESTQPSEAQILRLDCSKAHQQLQWRPTWPLRKAVREVAHWQKAWLASRQMHKVSTDTIDRFVCDSQKCAAPIG
jgi:CDP-glucose 4,6-dehydratase